MMMLTIGTIAPTDTVTIPGRVGIHHCTCNFHNIGFLYKIVQDWSLTHCYMG